MLRTLFPCSSWKHVQSYNREATEWIFKRSIIHEKSLFPWRESWKFHSIAKLSFFSSLWLVFRRFVTSSRENVFAWTRKFRIDTTPPKAKAPRVFTREPTKSRRRVVDVTYNVARKEKRLWKFAAIGPWQWIFTRVENIKRNPLIWKLLLRDNADKIALVALSVIAEKLDVVRIN